LPTPIEKLPFWKDVVANYKTVKLRDLARQHRVPVADLQRALVRVGALGDGAPAPVPTHEIHAAAGGGRAARKLDEIRSQLGILPDGTVAKLLKIARKTVVEYRKKHGIDAFGGNRPGAGKRKAAAAPKRKPGRPPKARGKRPGRRSKLDSFRGIIGKKTDKAVAVLTGMTPENVRLYRKRHGIAAEWQAESGPRRGPHPKTARAAAAPPAAAAAPRKAGRRPFADARIDAVRDLVGKVPDAEIAKRAKVSRSAVSTYRYRNNIKAATGRGRPPKNRVFPTEIVAATPMAAPAPKAAPAAKAAAAPIAAAAPAPTPKGALVYEVAVSQGDASKCFGLVASGPVAAAQRAEAALGGAWVIRSIRLVADLLPE